MLVKTPVLKKVQINVETDPCTFVKVIWMAPMHGTLACGVIIYVHTIFILLYGVGQQCWSKFISHATNITVVCDITSHEDGINLDSIFFIVQCINVWENMQHLVKNRTIYSIYTLPWILYEAGRWLAISWQHAITCHSYLTIANIFVICDDIFRIYSSLGYVV